MSSSMRKMRHSPCESTVEFGLAKVATVAPKAHCQGCQCAASTEGDPPVREDRGRNMTITQPKPTITKLPARKDDSADASFVTACSTSFLSPVLPTPTDDEPNIETVIPPRISISDDSDPSTESSLLLSSKKPHDDAYDAGSEHTTLSFFNSFESTSKFIAIQTQRAPIPTPDLTSPFSPTAESSRAPNKPPTTGDEDESMLDITLFARAHPSFVARLRRGDEHPDEFDSFSISLISDLSLTSNLLFSYDTFSMPNGGSVFIPIPNDTPPAPRRDTWRAFSDHPACPSQNAHVGSLLDELPDVQESSSFLGLDVSLSSPPRNSKLRFPSPSLELSTCPSPIAFVDRTRLDILLDSDDSSSPQDTSRTPNLALTPIISSTPHADTGPASPRSVGLLLTPMDRWSNMVLEEGSLIQDWSLPALDTPYAASLRSGAGRALRSN